MSESISQDIAISGEGNIVVGKGDVIINPLPPTEARLRHDLGILLKNVETAWIKGVLEKSIHQAALLDLGMELRAEAIDNPWRMVLEGPDESRVTIPRGRKIGDIFNEANRLLLILGEPGSGKTTTLLQLARDLIGEVDQTFAQPIPVILNLSTWTDKRQPLVDWLLGELNSKYHLPKKDGRLWLEERRILPLLDGLDEVVVDNRVACVEQLNRLVSDYGLQGMVVCSRIKDYTALNVRLAFCGAIYIQPLTPEQVDQYLESSGDQLAGLRTTLQADKALQSLTQSPLILNIMSLAYQNVSADALSNPALSTNEARRRYLFDTYIARMFNRKQGGVRYDHKRTRQRLSWLARNMQRHNQDVFLIEGLQPSWLQTHGWQWIYVFTSRILSVLILGLGFAALGLISTWPRIGLFIGLSIGFIDVLRFEWLHKQKASRKPTALLWSIINTVVVWLLVVLLILVPHPIDEWLQRAGGAMIAALLFGAIFGARGGRQSLDNDIHTVEALHWSWNKALSGARIGGIVGVIFGVILGLINWISPLTPVPGGELITGLTFAVVLGVILGLIGVVIGGVRREIVETKSRPGEGIRLLMRSAIIAGVIFASIFTVVLAALASLAQYPLRTYSCWLELALIGVFWYGGLDILQHFVLRLILVVRGHIPAHYARFLDYGVDRIFLQNVGGGYRFIHRSLLEHFALIDETRKV